MLMRAMLTDPLDPDKSLRCSKYCAICKDGIGRMISNELSLQKLKNLLKEKQYFSIVDGLRDSQILEIILCFKSNEQLIQQG